MDTRTLLEAVDQVAQLAGNTALSHYQKGVAIELKKDRSPVTRADRESETAARQFIEANFPDDGVLGEEFGETRPLAHRRWILDPIDGTATFIRGVPLWGTLVAVAEGRQVLAGAAYFPTLGERVVAARGQGAFWNGKRCFVSSESELSSATILTTDPRMQGLTQRRQRFEALEARAGFSRSWGDCYGYLLVATGRAEVMVDAILSAWDAAAVQPIIEEAGGIFTDWTGEATSFGNDAIATNRALGEPVRALLCERK